MDSKRFSGNNNAVSYSNLFNLQSLTSFQLPQHDDEFDYYGNSSQDDSRERQGGTMGDLGNKRKISERKLSMSNQKRRSQFVSTNSDNEEVGNYGAHISEEWYRSMLGDHVQKYRRRLKDSSASPAGTQTAIPGPRSSLAPKSKEVETVSEWFRDTNSRKPVKYHEAEYTPDYVTNRTSYEVVYLDIGDDISYRIPPTYDKMATSLNLPSFSGIRVDELYLKGTLDLGSLAAMMTAEKRLDPSIRAGMGEPRCQYGSLQEKLKALSASNSAQKFSLKVTESGMTSGIPEGVAGNIPRSILSEGGVLQVYYVKVLEKGDTYEIIERSLPKKQKIEKDPSAIEREEMEKVERCWFSIVRRDIPKYHRTFTTFHRKQLIDAKRFSENCQREVKLKVSRSLKLMRGATIRTRKLARDMLLYWKRVDKEMTELRRKEEKEAAEALKREQEAREEKRQEQRLNFLLQQTELYSHFMQHKSEALPTDNMKGEQDLLLDSSQFEPIKEEDPEDAEWKKRALRMAQEAYSKQKKLTDTFDDECSRLRDSVDTSKEGSTNIDLVHPSTMPVASSVQTPEMFKGCLKDYQLKGLQWLVNCYEQGLNGILADEMGLGKTIQAMAFLAHLAEEKNIWGPFLVVAPASVLNNWADEINRFCPDLKIVPYWGGLQERTILRKNMNPKRLYRREAGFHILITSYQLLVLDEKYFRRVKWQYMVLDEAQAIKSSTSTRWKTLLSFNCRNRLLLTGTPIQNNMAELWALLHFIMPTLFDSHEQFNEWFSKGIENHAEHGGTLNEHQLNRLHAILKPFMLRRVKKDVVSELTRKTEVTVHCKLSSRQQAFYRAIKNKISLAELFDNNHGRLNEKKIMNLMNIVIQLRKVCNHPELFERNEGTTYLYFGEIGNSLLPPQFGELEEIHYSGSRNPITYEIPKLVYQEFHQTSGIDRASVRRGLCKESFEKYFNIFSQNNVYRSIHPREYRSDGLSLRSGAFGFTCLMNLTPVEVAFVATSSLMERLLFSIARWDDHSLESMFDFIVQSVEDDAKCSHFDRGKVRVVARMLLMPSRCDRSLLTKRIATGPGHASLEPLLVSHEDRIRSCARLLHSTHTFIPPTRAPPINAHCSDRNFAYKIVEEQQNPWIKRLLLGFARTSDFSAPRKPEGRTHTLVEEIDSLLPVSQPALQLTYKIFGSCPPIRSFDPAKLLTDSGKLQTLDILLKRLRADNHRVLLFAQMTKMLNILEDYMNYRKYRYLRLDGSSTIMDRRDMVKDFQHRSDIFVFLLSTRAGGLGINLTAADTVIFYESDWNPTLDLQAMDRAHRLGQTKDVTVYRLICKETVEEKILQRASQKNTVQQVVLTGGHIQGDILASEDVLSLLLDDAQLEQKLRDAPLLAKDRQKKKGKAIRIDAEGDATLEDLSIIESQVAEDPLPEPEITKSSNRKRKATSDKQIPAKPRSQKAPQNGDSHLQMTDFQSTADYDVGEPYQNADNQQPQTPKRPKRPKKSVNENIEPAYISTNISSEQTQYTPVHEFGSGSFTAGEGTSSQSGV